MKNGKLLDLYSDYLISAFGQTTATGLSALDLLQKCVLESGFEFHITDGSNQIVFYK